ncbi:MAG: FtsL-like putative cell division protein [Flavobacteriaceae bacterium]|nr:FtsL-like putative cell division protein [Flavobacteriaceae bacterium]
MAKKRKHKKNEFGFSDILKGNFLNREEIKNLYGFFTLIFFLLMILIYSNYCVTKKTKELNALKTKVEEIKSRNAYIQSRLIKIKLESELSREVEKDSLKALDTHPLKILIK